MRLEDFIGETFDDPCRSIPIGGDIRDLWDKPQRLRERGKILRSASGKTMVYTQLAYVPGLTATCGVRGVPILTGYMSGCFLFRYTDADGQMRVAHVGTDIDNPEAGDKAKAAWKTIANNPNVTNVMGFDPLKDVTWSLLTKAQSFGVPQIVGYWDVHGIARVAVFATPPLDMSKRILVAVESALMKPWDVIKNDRKML